MSAGTNGDWSVAEATALRNVVMHAENDCCHDDAWRGRFCPYHLGMVDGIEVAMLALRGELDAPDNGRSQEATDG